MSNKILQWPPTSKPKGSTAIQYELKCGSVDTTFKIAAYEYVVNKPEDKTIPTKVQNTDVPNQVVIDLDYEIPLIDQKTFLLSQQI